ncbi:MAG: hypothetical protein ACREOU_02215 [Candidatus Eiseniibacteriota bacterium]
MRVLLTRLALIASFVLAVAGPAAADVTVVNHWTLVNGDTLTRANYFSQKRVRVTGPDGREFMFDAKTDTITVIDHGTRRYWTGPRAEADSVASAIMAANREGVPAMATEDPVAWGERIQAFNDSIKIEPTMKGRKIAGYPCNQWLLSAGSYLQNEEWIARSLTFPNYGPELQKAVMASIKDPLGRQLMRLIIDAKAKEGTALAAHTTFRTLTREGSFGYEAVRVKSGKIPASAWAIPAGYERFVR